MRTKTLCTSCEQYVYTDADHSCHDAKALRAVRDAEAAVVEKALSYEQCDVRRAIKQAAGLPWPEAVAESGLESAHRDLLDAVRALHAARQGGAS
jgi:hypothetical protein